MPSLRILMYCNTSRGMGRTARTLGIAASLSQTLEYCSILVLTDLATIGRFKLAERVDYVHLPALAESSNGYAMKPGLKLDRKNTLRMRQKIATSALKTFRPDLVWLDDSLLNLPEELHKILACLQADLPEAKVVWAFSDTLGHPDFVLRQWVSLGAPEIFERCGDEFLVLGVRALFDAVKAYRLPESLSRKVIYTGYLSSREKAPKRMSEKLAKTESRLPTILLTTDGSAHDFAALEAYLDFLEKTHMEVQSIIIAGLGFTSAQKRAIKRRVQALPRVGFKRFSKHLAHYIRHADAVICTGEYSVMSEVLARRKAALLVPHAEAQPDNFHRAQRLEECGLVAVSAPEDFQADVIEAFLAKHLFGEPRLEALKNSQEISSDGFKQISESIQRLTGGSRQFEAVAAS